MNSVEVKNRKEQEAEYMEPRTWVIVTQVKSNRVIYFSDDPNYEPHMEGDWYYFSIYDGLLPSGMELGNCWGWRFNGSSFEDARVKKKQSRIEKIVEVNRKSLQKILKEKIETIRSEHLPRYIGGELLRTMKLCEANDYLKDPSLRQRFPLLESVALAKKISMVDAANFIVKIAKESDSILVETERFREYLGDLISSASSIAELEELREILIEDLYPHLKNSHKVSRDNTQPPNPDEPLSEANLLHERSRLKALLQEVINEIRAPVHSGYIRNEEVRRAKYQVAIAFLANEEEARKMRQFALLAEYAKAKRLEIRKAAEILVRSTVEAQNILLESEKTKDHYLGKIESILCVSDVDEIGRELHTLLLNKSVNY